MLKFWKSWKDGLKWKRLKPFNKVSGMVVSHWEGIASWCKKENRVPLGFVEGLNNRVRTIHAKGYGYHDIDHFDLKIFTCKLPKVETIGVNLE